MNGLLVDSHPNTYKCGNEASRRILSFFEEKGQNSDYSVHCVFEFGFVPFSLSA